MLKNEAVDQQTPAGVNTVRSTARRIADVRGRVEDDERHAAPGEMMPDRKTGLAAADDDGVDALC